MSDNECQRCAQLADRCTYLEDRCSDLESQIEKLEERIEELEDILREIRQYCLRVIAKANKILSQRSGVPRGQWAFAKGARGVAVAILSRLG